MIADKNILDLLDSSVPTGSKFEPEQSINPGRLALHPEINRVSTVFDNLYIEVEVYKETSNIIQTIDAQAAAPNEGGLIITRRALVLACADKIITNQGITLDVAPGDTIFLKEIRLEPGAYGQLFSFKSKGDRIENLPKNKFTRPTGVIKAHEIVAVIKADAYVTT